MEEDYGDLPIEDFVHKLMVNLIQVKWLLYAILIAEVLSFVSK